MPFVTRFDTGSMRFGVLGALLVAQYRGPPTLEDLKRSAVIEDELLERYEKVSMLTVVSNTGALRLPQEVRDYSVQLSARFAPRLRGSAVVVVSKGLGAAMARAFLSAFMLLSRADLPLRNCATLDDAVDWLRGLPEQDPEVARSLTRKALDAFLAD